MNEDIVSITIDGLTLHGIRCGKVQVKRSHAQPSTGMPLILIDPFWTEFLPIWVWVIEHPEGVIVIDTGENASVKQPNYFDCGGINGWINKQILRFEMDWEAEIGSQLLKLGIHPEQVRWVVLTHLHIDHTDGLKYFPKSEIVVSKQEWTKPYGAVPCTFPQWFRPCKITYTQNDKFFGHTYSLTKDERIQLVPTPGHSYGHQSVILRTPEWNVLFAGDTTFDEAQLIKEQVAGICVDKRKAKQTLQSIKAYCQQKKTLYLPSHDPLSGHRLTNQIPTILK
jgi:N-acyl homoserine lactone hydrolase